MADRRRRRKNNNTSYASTKFTSKFALFGCLGSIIAICILAIVCQIIDYTTNYDKHTVEKTYASEDLHIHRRSLEQVNKLLLDRRLEQQSDEFGSSDSISTVDKLTHRRLEQADEFGSDNNSMPCGDIFLNVKKNTTNNTTDTFYQQRLCNYANTCHGDYPSTKFLPLILCHNIDTNTTSIQYKLQTIYIYILLPPILLLYLLLLFRLLATTADSYFSPALESFSFELNLPPRFAGATLLALGNGSPDLGSTVNALLLWNDDDSSSSTSNGSITNGKSNLHGQGWQMSLGSLVGGGMFVGTIVCGLLIQSCNGIQCRVAFLRDVSMYALSVGIVWYTLESGTVTRSDVYLFLGIYLGYIVIILISDVYHRRVTLKRLHEEGRERRRSIKKRLSKLVEGNGENTTTERTSLMESIIPNDDYGGERSEKLKPGKQGVRINDDIDYIDSESAGDEEDKISTRFDSSNSLSIKYPRRPGLNVRDRLAMLMSNYDPLSVRRFDTSSSRASASSIGSMDDGTAELERITSLFRQAHPGIHSSFIQPSKSEEDGVVEQQLYQQPQQQASYMFGSIDEREEPELSPPKWSACLFKDAFDELVWRGQTFLTNSFQNEESVVGKIGLFLELPLIALRTVCIPVPCEDYYCRPIVALSVILSPYWLLWYTSAGNIPAIVYCFICLIIGLSVLRYADDEKLPLFAGTVISLYGFAIAATWIDTIASNLVGLLQFLGTISRIPSSILGITILAWGNSMGDLSANLAMARKGMPDMATTGCFAGPSFNLLVGTGLSFLNLQYKLNRSSISPLALTRTIRCGFAFIIINCLLIVTIGVFFKWRQLPYKYSFVLFGIYSMFILTSLEPALHWSGSI